MFSFIGWILGLAITLGVVIVGSAIGASIATAVHESKTPGEIPAKANEIIEVAGVALVVVTAIATAAVMVLAHQTCRLVDWCFGTSFTDWFKQPVTIAAPVAA